VARNSLVFTAKTRVPSHNDEDVQDAAAGTRLGRLEHLPARRLLLALGFGALGESFLQLRHDHLEVGRFVCLDEVEDHPGIVGEQSRGRRGRCLLGRRCGLLRVQRGRRQHASHQSEGNPYVPACGNRQPGGSKHHGLLGKRRLL
jgi:hypothetical protein